MFTGGTPYEYLTPNITLMQGKSLSMLSCDNVIVDFIAIPSSPHISDQLLLLRMYVHTYNVFIKVYVHANLQN